MIRMFKNILIIILLVVAFNALFVFTGGLDMLVKTEQAEEQKIFNVDPDIVDVFRFTLEDEVIKKQGQPIEGFEPQMFMAVFPGLAGTDFDGVKASIGTYIVVDGRLEHDLSEASGPIHSAAGTINRTGYQTLLNNVARRAGIDLQNDGTITDVMSAVTAN